MYNQDLALISLQGLICRKTQLNQLNNQQILETI